MENEREETIDYASLTEGAQREIDRYPEESVPFTFYARRHARGYQVHAVADSLLALLEAQGGMGPGWMRVTFGEGE